MKILERRIKANLMKEFKTIEELNTEIEKERYEDTGSTLNLEVATDEIAKELSKDNISGIDKDFRQSTFLTIRADALKEIEAAKFFRHPGIRAFEEGLHGVKLVFGCNNSVWLKRDEREELFTPVGIEEAHFDYEAEKNSLSRKQLNEIFGMYHAGKILSERAAAYSFNILGDSQE